MYQNRTGAWKSAFGEIKSFMLSAINKELSFNEFYRTAVETGLSYRREKMLVDWRNVQGLYKFETHLASLDPMTSIPERLVTNEFFTKKNNYLAGIEYKYIDPLTGKTKTNMYLVDSAELQSPADYLRIAQEALMAETAPYKNPSAHEFKLRYVLGRRPE